MGFRDSGRMDVIDVSGLHHRYGSFTAVAGVDFAVREGKIFALLGTNGAGKTTTLEIVEGFRSPTGGQVRVFGRDPGTDRARLSADVGVMLQSSGLIGELTVAETLELWGGLRSRTDSSPELLSTVDLLGRRDVAVEKLSGGERRRLDFALAIWGRPPLLILDEPTTGLDPESRARLWDTVSALRANGTTVLLTTHYLEEAQALADRIAIMHAGRIELAGTLAEVLTNQPARITATVPPDVPLPLFHGTPTVDGRTLTVVTQELQDDLYTLLRWADQHNVRMDAMAANPASLQEIFLSIGRAAV